MNHDFFPNGAYRQLTEIPPTHPYHQYEIAKQPNTGGPSSYQMMSGGSCSSESFVPAARSTPLHQHESRKRRIISYAENYDSASDTSVAASATSTMDGSTTKKRKASNYGNSSGCDDDDTRSNRAMPDKKQNHSEIEKRRRDKMNTYITELSAMVPMCGAMARKLDKLTVLRLAVQHMRSVRGALTSCPLASRPRPACVTQHELNELVLDAANDAFVLVVGCDRGKLLYVSASVTKLLNYRESELMGQSLFDILHPKDVAKVKEQLSASDLSPRERLIDAKTMLPVRTEIGAAASRLCPGARRSFFCRIKCKQLPAEHNQTNPVKEEGEPVPKMRKKYHEKKYCVVQFTGYLKAWAPVELFESGLSTENALADLGGLGLGAEGEEDNATSCLVCVGRALATLAPPVPPAPVPHPAQHRAPQPPPTRPLQFFSRHAIDGKYLFVDQRVTMALGYLPQEVLGTSLYEYVSGCELGGVARAHKHSLLRRQALLTPPYSARCKDGTHATVQTQFKPFKNPWTKDIECLVAQNTLVSEAQPPAHDSAYSELLKQKADEEVQRLIDSHVESHKIGSAIAEEALRRASADLSPELPPDLLQDVVFNQALVDNILGSDMSYRVRNNVPLSAAGARSPPESGGAGETVAAETETGGVEGETTLDSPLSVSPPLPIDGNGEAAMAVIMSLLEADAGLGGPVNFSGLPWPLP